MSKEMKIDQDSKINKPDDTVGLNVSGHILIKDKETGEELVGREKIFNPPLCARLKVARRTTCLYFETPKALSLIHI